MTVKQLIKKLMKLDPDAQVCIESYRCQSANEVKQFQTNQGALVYIADSTEYIENEMSAIKEGSDKETNALDLFLEEEIPFRMKEYIGVSDDDIEKIKDVILDGLCISGSHTVDVIDYEKLDNFITDKLSEHGIEYGG